MMGPERHSGDKTEKYNLNIVIYKIYIYTYEYNEHVIMKHAFL